MTAPHDSGRTAMHTQSHPPVPRLGRLQRLILLGLSLALAAASSARGQFEEIGCLGNRPGVVPPRPPTVGEAMELRRWASCGAQHRAAAYVCCDGKGGFAVCRGRGSGHRLLEICIGRHEKDHLEWFTEHLPRACASRPRGACRFEMTRAQFRELECRGYLEELRCLTESRGLAGGRRHGVARLVSRQRQLLREAEARFACRLREG